MSRQPSIACPNCGGRLTIPVALSSTLTPKEESAWTALVDAHPGFLSASEWAERLGYSHPVSAQNARVYVMRLREQGYYIINQYGRGYRAVLPQDLAAYAELSK